MWGDNWRRNLLALWIGQVVSIVAFSFVVPFTPLFLQTLDVRGATEAAQWTGFITALPSLSMALAQPFWGRLADRSGRKPMVIRSIVGSGILTLVAGLVTSAWQLLAIRFFQGMITGTMTASTALVATSMPRSRVGFGLGVIQMAMFVGQSVGPFLGGLIADNFGYRASFYAAGTLMILGATVVSVFVREDFTPAPAAARSKGILAEGRSMMAIALFPLMMGVAFVVQFGNFTVSPIITLFVAELSSGENAATASGVILAATGVASAVAAVTFGRISDRVGHAKILYVCLAGAALSYLPQTLVREVWELLVLRILLGVFLGGLMPSVNALIAGLVPRERRGIAFGLNSSATSLSHAVAPLFGAGVATFWGMRAVLLATGVIYALAYVGTLLGFRRSRPPRADSSTRLRSG